MKIFSIHIFYESPTPMIETLILPTTILKIISIHALSLTAAWPLAAQPAQAAVRDKIWKETILKLWREGSMSRMIGVESPSS